MEERIRLTRGVVVEIAGRSPSGGIVHGSSNVSDEDTSAGDDGSPIASPGGDAPRGVGFARLRAGPGGDLAAGGLHHVGGPRIMRLAYEMVCVLVSWPFM